MGNSQFPASIFREYDIRGLAGSELTPEFAYQLGVVFGKTLFSKSSEKSKRLKVSVGRDCRLTSDAFADQLMRGIITTGIDVLDLGTCPTPLTYFSIFQHQLDGGIMVTGSHNPAEYNGFKICIGKTTIFGDEIQAFRKALEEKQGLSAPSVPSGTVSKLAIIPEYVDYLTKHAQNLKPMKIVLDSGNGTASTVAPILFEKLGAQVFPLFCELDGRFPNHHPDPTVPANLKALVDKVLEVKADFGVAFDGDSDRIGVVDEKGTILFGDELMVLLSRSVLKALPGATIISEVKSSHKLYNDIAARGGKGIMWKTGHSLIKSKMKETHASLAGEMSGHIFFADRYFGFDDAIYAALRVYEILSAEEMPLSSLLSDLPKTVSTPEIRVDCVESKKFAVVNAVKEILEKSYTVNSIDGVRVEFGDSWGLVRASNTQPVLVLRFEAPSQEKLNQARGIIENALSLAAKAVGHPMFESLYASKSH